MGYISLAAYYKYNFDLMQHHKYNLYDIENMYPYERDIYIDLLREYIKQQEEANRK